MRDRSYVADDRRERGRRNAAAEKLCVLCVSVARDQNPWRRSGSGLWVLGLIFTSAPMMLCTLSCVSIRFDAFAAAKMRSTISSVAGRPRLSSQKITFDRPDIGAASDTTNGSQRPRAAGRRPGTYAFDR